MPPGVGHDSSTQCSLPVTPALQQPLRLLSSRLLAPVSTYLLNLSALVAPPLIACPPRCFPALISHSLQPLEPL